MNLLIVIKVICFVIQYNKACTELFGVIKVTFEFI